jgi:hypothetical protein
MARKRGKRKGRRWRERDIEGMCVMEDKGKRGLEKIRVKERTVNKLKTRK